MRVIVLLAMFCCTRPGMFDDPCCIYSSRDRLVQDFTTSNDTWRLIRCKDNLMYVCRAMRGEASFLL